MTRLVKGFGEKMVIRMLKRAGKARMTGGGLEDALSLGGLMAATKTGPIAGPILGTLSTIAQFDDFHSEQLYGSAGGQVREAANMAPLLPAKKIVQTLRGLNLRGPRVAQLGQGRR